jgi:3-deoxy-D-manno-octulosonic-acid transferase
MILFDLLYILILIPLAPLWIKVLLKKEYRTLLKHRLSPNIKPSSDKRLWIHAVSMGEVRSLKYLIEQFKETYKGKEIVLSVSTPSGYNCALEEYKDISVINAPVDFSFTIRKFIKVIDPELLVLNELEIWPNWVRITYKKKIPIVLINGRISETAFHRYRKGLFFFRHFFAKIQMFLVQAELYKERFLQLNIPAEKITVCGSIKADEAFNRMESLLPDNEIMDYLKIEATGKTIVTLASSHQKDEEQLIPIINKAGDRFTFIIIPRHLSRVQEVERLLETHGVGYLTWSKIEKNSEKGGKDFPNVLIFDKIGYLFNVLKVSGIVFMGGTFDPRTGGHNLYEPAVLGKYIIGGPHYNNFPAIGDELVKKGVYHVVRSPGEILEKLLHLDTVDWESVKKESVRAVSGRKGSIRCIIKEIEQFIPRQVTPSQAG